MVSWTSNSYLEYTCWLFPYWHLTLRPLIHATHWVATLLCPHPLRESGLALQNRAHDLAMHVQWQPCLCCSSIRPLCLFLLHFCPPVFLYFLSVALGWLPWVSWPALVPNTPNLLLTDHLYSLLGYRSFKNALVSPVTWYKLDGDGPENDSPSPTEITKKLTP